MSMLAQMAAQGKVRDVYQAGDDRLLMVASDRISAFDVVLPNPIPDKGRVLTGLSLFWFEETVDVVGNHLLSADVEDFPEAFREHAAELAGRAMLVRKAEMLPIECVARGYLSGSGWKEYAASGTVCGIRLPEGLAESEKLPEPIYTPATKAETGHDENVSFDLMARTVGAETAAGLRDLTLAVYRKGAAYAETKGLILADTKLEFGVVDGAITLIDEVLTPDSSRYWPKSAYRVGVSPPSFDKQFVRDYLESIGFAKKPPGPVLPDDVVRKTSAKYLEAYRLLTGRELAA